MLPVLFKLGRFEIRTYGLLLALAFFLGFFLALARARKRNVSEDHITNLFYTILISSLIGARLFYVLFHIPEFQGRWLYTFWPVQEDGTIGIGGLMILGGVVFAFFFSYLYLRRKKQDFLIYADIVAPVLALGIFFGRLGCFFNGCCFGHECTVPWGVVFPPESPAGAVMGHKLIHPTQLYESLFNLLLFFFMLGIEKKWPSIEKFKGAMIAIFLMGYGIERFIVDFYRYYESQMYIIAGLDFNQLVSLAMFFSGVGILVYRWKQLKSANN